MSLIKVTEKSRNGVELATPSDILIDTDDISRPMYENSSGEVVLYLQESILNRRQAEPLNVTQYVLTDDLPTVADLSEDIFIGTVVTRNGRPPVAGLSVLAFNAERIVGAIRKNGAADQSIFLYHEEGDHLPVEYIVEETIAQIETKLITS